MQPAASSGTLPTTESPIPRRIAFLRLGIGLLQGIALYLLYLVGDYDVWPAIEPLLYAPMLLVALFCPLLLVSGLGQLTRRQALLWVAGAAVVVAGLALYDIWRRGSQLDFERDSHVAMPSPALWGMLVVGLFIAHALVLSGARDRRRIASYATYFDIAWKLGVQLAFSGLFVGITWLALHLGAELFKLVKLTFFAELIREPWFSIPVTSFAYACALHLTDVRPAIVQGIRGLLLTLASWILPVLTVFVGAFLLSLPFTGLAPLWATRQAATVLLLAAAALVVLINAAWQNGSAPVARPVRLSARVAALLLAPVVAIAVYALALRVGDYGWTHDRIVAAACTLVALCYALGYGAAALRRGWLELVAPVNVATAFVVLGVMLALFSPLLDPARLSVNDQMARLQAGRITVDKFDFAYLRFDGKRFGNAALAQLEARAGNYPGSRVRERIAAVRKMQYAWDKKELAPLGDVIAANLHPRPQGLPLPDSFLRTDWTALPDYPFPPNCLSKAGEPCEVYQLDVTGDGKPEILVVGSAEKRTLVFGEQGAGKWHVIASTGNERDCIPDAQAAGELPRALTPRLSDIAFAGKRLRLIPVVDRDTTCNVD